MPPETQNTAFTNPNLTIISYVAFTFLGYFTIGLTLAVLPQYIHGSLAFSTMIAGIVISLQYAATFLFRGFGGKIVDKKGPKPAVMMSMIGFILSGIILLAVSFLKDQRILSLALLVVMRLVTGFSEGLVGASPINWAIFRVGNQHTAKAISYNGIGNYGALAAGAPLGVIISNSFGISYIAYFIILIGIGGLIYANSKINIILTSKEAPQSFFNVLKKVTPFGLCLAAGGIGFGAISTFVTLYYSYLNWTGAVLCLSLFSIMFVLGRLIFAGAINQYGGMKTAIACLAMEAFGLGIIALSVNPMLTLIGAGIAGFGFSLVFPALGVEAVRLIPASSQGSALGNYGLFIDLSLGITGPLLGAISTGFGMNYLFPFSLCIVVMGLVLAISIQYRRQKQGLQAFTEI
ncbi:MFS transporter [Pedobacter mucosus]|uniref:MFS transporter n=1 Tax=Pedobacter mucosus TaxID=2895286 RepID=UPI001EE43A5E|nr:MFS transporter [Pedobacter mucosus]UKT65196.1 MFS transporter [Pedobacter mucosus]